MIYTDAMIAETVHTVNGLLQRFHGEEHRQPAWQDAPPEMRARVTELVRGYRRGLTPRDAHAQWVRAMTGQGWVWGPDVDERKLTHPNLVDYWELPDCQKIKDVMSHQIATVMIIESRPAREAL